MDFVIWEAATRRRKFRRKFSLDFSSDMLLAPASVYICPVGIDEDEQSKYLEPSH